MISIFLHPPPPPQQWWKWLRQTFSAVSVPSFCMGTNLYFNVSNSILVRICSVKSATALSRVRHFTGLLIMFVFFVVNVNDSVWLNFL